jgi:hypothetical protein
MGTCKAHQYHLAYHSPVFRATILLQGHALQTSLQHVVIATAIMPVRALALVPRQEWCSCTTTTSTHVSAFSVHAYYIDITNPLNLLAEQQQSAQQHPEVLRLHNVQRYKGS